MSNARTKSVAGRILAAIPAVCLLALMLPVVASAAGDKPAATGGGDAGMNAQAMQKMMEYMTPGAPHAALAKSVGHWTTAIKMWMGPGDPTVTQGTADYEMILGGRYLSGKMTGSFNGMPYEGNELDGYDNGKKEYFSIWIDNMGTGVAHLTGKASDDGKVTTYTGKMYEPESGSDLDVREEIRRESDTHWVLSMWGAMKGPDGKMHEMKMMEIAADKS